MQNATGENLVQFNGNIMSEMKFDSDTNEEVVDASVEQQPEVEVNTESEVQIDDGKDAQTSNIDKANEAMHLAIIDAITDKFDDLSHGRITKDELKAWLDKNPLYHEKADRSKRLKNEYRTFMTQYNKSKEQQIVQGAQNNNSIDVNDIVRKTVAQALAERDAQQGEKQFFTSIDEYAASRNLKDDQYDLFKKTAVALSQAGISKDSVFTMAYNAVVPVKHSGASIQGGSIIQAKAPSQEVDLSSRDGAVFINIPLGDR